MGRSTATVFGILAGAALLSGVLYFYSLSFFVGAEIYYYIGVVDLVAVIVQKSGIAFIIFVPGLFLIRSLLQYGDNTLVYIDPEQFKKEMMDELNSIAGSVDESAPRERDEDLLRRIQRLRESVQENCDEVLELSNKERRYAVGSVLGKALSSFAKSMLISLLVSAAVGLAVWFFFSIEIALACAIAVFVLTELGSYLNRLGAELRVTKLLGIRDGEHTARTGVSMACAFLIAFSVVFGAWDAMHLRRAVTPPQVSSGDVLISYGDISIQAVGSGRVAIVRRDEVRLAEYDVYPEPGPSLLVRWLH